MNPQPHLSRRATASLLAALLLSACAGNAPRPEVPPPAPPPAATAPPTAAPPPTTAPAPPRLTPEQIAAERKALPKVLAYLGDLVRKNKSAFTSGMGLPANSPAAQRFGDMLVSAMSDPVAQKAFTEKATDEDIEAIAAAKDQNYTLGSTIGSRIDSSLKDLPDDEKARLLETFSHIFAAATPGECQRILNQSKGDTTAFLLVLDRLPASDTDVMMSTFLDAARTGKMPPQPPLTAMEGELVKLALVQYIGNLPPDQQARLRAAVSNPQSPDKCWVAAQSMKGILATEPETRNLGVRMFFQGGFGKK